MAETFEVNCAPHNYYSHLSTLHSLHLCNISPNIRICEIDIGRCALKDDLVTERLEFDSGCVVIPNRPGWGADLNEEVARKHVWGTWSVYRATGRVGRESKSELGHPRGGRHQLTIGSYFVLVSVFR